MQKVKILADKSAPMSPMIRLMCGDTRTQIVHFIVNRLFGEVDLCELSWKIKVVDAKGEADIHEPHGEVVCSAEQIEVEWLIHGIATSTPGETRFELIGVDEGADGDPIIWQSGIGTILVTECLHAESSGNTEQLSELNKLIVYVDGELKNVIASGKAAEDAAKRANDAADRIENGVPGGSASAMVVNIENSGTYNLKLDKTFEEIYAAHEVGTIVYAHDQIGEVYTLTNVAKYGITFETSDSSHFKILHVSPDGNNNHIEVFERVTPERFPKALPNPAPLYFTGSTVGIYTGKKHLLVRVADNWNDLRDKPFGRIGTDKVLMPPSNIEFDAQGMAECEAYLDFEDGATYEVDFGGEKFAGIAKFFTIENITVGYIGNLALAEMGEDNGEPYLVGSVPSQGFAVFAFPSAAGKTVRTTVTGVLTERKIPAEYLPDSLGAVDKVNVGKLLYVDADGYLQPVTLGSGLQLTNGVLSVTGAISNAGTSALGEATLGEMILGQ